MVVHLRLGNNLAFACQNEDLSASHVVLRDVQLMVVLSQRSVCAPAGTFLIRFSSMKWMPQLWTSLKDSDPEIFDVIEKEKNRQVGLALHGRDPVSRDAGEP